MATVRRIFKNSFFLLAGRAISILLSMVFSIYAARKMGVLNFGQFSFIVSLISYFLLFSGAELQNLLVRDIAYKKERSQEYLTTAIVFKLIITCVSIVLIILLMKLIDKLEIILPMVIAAFSLMPSCIYDAFDAVFRGYEKMKYIAISTSAYSILRTGLGIFLISQGVGLSALFIGLLVVEIFKTLLIFLFHSRHIGFFRWSFKPEILKYLFRESYILIFIKGILGLLYYRADIVFLAVLLGDIAVGHFSVAVNLSGLFVMVSAVVLNAILPVVSQWYQASRAKMFELLRLSLKYTISVFVPLIAFFTFFSKYIIQFLYGKEYVISAPILAIVIWSALFSTLLGLQGIVLLVSDQYRRMSRIYILMTVMKVVLSYWLIQNFGLIGAAIGYSLSDGLALVFYYTYARSELKGLVFRPIFIKILFSMAIFIWVFYLMHHFGNIFSFTLAFLVYLFILFLMRVFNFRELKFLALQANPRFLT